MPEFSKRGAFTSLFIKGCLSRTGKMDLNKQLQWLTACLFHDHKILCQLEQLEGAEWDSLVEYSKDHLVTPILYQRLKMLPETILIPVGVMQRLHSIYIQCVAGSIQLRSELIRALQCIEKAGIPYILLKGVHLQEFVYGDIGLRVMEDVDSLFHRKDLYRAQACLLSEGFLKTESRLQVDVHWYIEQYLDVDMQKIWNSARLVRIDSIDALILSPKYLIVHLCVHL